MADTLTPRTAAACAPVPVADPCWPHLHRRPSNTNRQIWLSLPFPCFLVHPRFCLCPPSVSGEYKVAFKHYCALLPSSYSFSFPWMWCTFFFFWWAKFTLKLKKLGKTTSPFKYDLKQIPYNYTVEVRNRFKGLDLIDRVLMNYGQRFVTLYRRQGARPSPRKRNTKQQNGSLRRPYK